jgi:hypothetical protein
MKILSVLTTSPSKASHQLSQQEIEAMVSFMAEMRSKGILIDTGGRRPDMLELRVARKNGATTVTDGPFTEAKEIVGGFAVLEVRDRDEAVAVTNRLLDIIGDATCQIHEVDETP